MYHYLRRIAHTGISSMRVSSRAYIAAVHPNFDNAGISTIEDYQQKEVSSNIPANITMLDLLEQGQYMVADIFRCQLDDINLSKHYVKKVQSNLTSNDMFDSTFENTISPLLPKENYVSTINSISKEGTDESFQYSSEKDIPELLSSQCTQFSYGSDRYNADFPAFHLGFSPPQFDILLSDVSASTSMMTSSAVQSRDIMSLMQDSTLYYSKPSNTNKGASSGGRHERPNSDVLLLMQDYLVDHFPHLFHRTHNYSVYTPDIVFENFYNMEKGFTRNGINAYALQLSKYRIAAHFSYANIRLHVRSASIDEEEGCIRLVWAMYGLSNLEAFKFWKFLPGSIKKDLDSNSDLYAGVSTFWVNTAGKIYKHRVTRVIQNKPPEVSGKQKMTAKLASMLNPELKPALTKKSKIN